MTKRAGYSYKASLKSERSDEPINTLLVRPAAGVIVWLLYPLPVTPNHVTLISIGVGIAAAAFFLGGPGIWAVLAGVLVELKDVLDSADGQLARVRRVSSRAGRFLDSIGDFFVNMVLMAAVAIHLYTSGASVTVFAAAAAAFLCMTLRVSFHVFYQVSYLHLAGSYGTNRLTEQITSEDQATESRVTILLHKVFLLLYGWQDTLMAAIDRWMLPDRGLPQSAALPWYGDGLALRLGGFLGLGTELFVLALCAVAGLLPHYFAVSLLGMNGLWVAVILYRKLLLAPRIEARA